MGGTQFTEARANHGQSDKFRGLFIAHAGDRDERNPFADAEFAEQGKRVGNGMNFGDERKSGGVQITEQAVAERSFRLDALTDFAEVHPRLIDVSPGGRRAWR